MWSGPCTLPWTPSSWTPGNHICSFIILKELFGCVGKLQANAHRRDGLAPVPEPERGRLRWVLSNHVITAGDGDDERNAGAPRPIDATRGEINNPSVPLFLRATALLLSVSHLVLVTRNACHMSGSLDWIDQSLHAAEDHMVVLREAALASEPERSLPGADAQREQAI